MAAVAGLGGSVALWVVALLANEWAARRVVAGLPAEWRTHPDLSGSYSSPGAAGYLTALARLLPWLAAAVACFVALSALDVLPGVQAGAALVGGAWWASTVRSQSRASARAIAERDGLATPARVPGRAVWVATTYLLCVAIALSTCFAGQAIWALVS